MNWLKKLLDKADDPFQELWKQIEQKIHEGMEETKRKAKVELLQEGAKMSLARLIDLDPERQAAYRNALSIIGE